MFDVMFGHAEKTVVKWMYGDNFFSSEKLILSLWYDLMSEVSQCAKKRKKEKKPTKIPQCQDCRNYNCKTWLYLQFYHLPR